MADATRRPLGPGDPAPDFELPAADVEGIIALGECLARGPVLLTMLRGLYCPFCRRQISQLRPTCETLRAAGVSLVGVVIASAERARRYFAHFPPCFPVAAAPDRAVHRAYGLPEVTRSPGIQQEILLRAVEQLREVGIQAPPGQEAGALNRMDGFDVTSEDRAERERPLQAVGYFLIGRDRVVRWARVDPVITPLPAVGDLLSMV